MYKTFKYCFTSGFLVFFISFMFCYGQEVNPKNLSKEQKPNITIFVADDLGVIDIEPYGSKTAITPNLAALRKEAMLFKQAFATSPTCVPARSALFTAQYPHQNGSFVNRMPVNSGVKSIVQYFRAQGYQIVIAGKLHVGPKEVFDFEYIKGSNRREPGTEGLQGMFTDLYLDPVKDWLAKRNDPRPFLLVVADHSPHVTWPLKPIYSNRDIKIHPFHIDTEDTRKMLSKYYTDITKMDNNVGEVLKMLKEKDLEKNTVFLFTADQGPQLPFGKWTLYDYGIQVPLLIRWPQHIQAGSTTKALVSHIDIIPTLLELVGGKLPIDIDGKSFVKVLKNPENKHRDVLFASHNGDKLLDQSPSRMLRTEQFKYILNLEPNAPVSTGKTPQQSWIKRANTNEFAKTIVNRLNARPAIELYNLAVDPYELNNLALSEKHRGLMDNFQKQLEIERKRQGDIDDSWKRALEKLPPDSKPNPVVPYTF